MGLANKAWGGGSGLIMNPYRDTVAYCSAEAQQWDDFVHISTLFFENRFPRLINGLQLSNEHSKNIIFATVVVQNICIVCNDLITRSVLVDQTAQF